MIYLFHVKYIVHKMPHHIIFKFYMLVIHNILRKNILYFLIGLLSISCSDDILEPEKKDTAENENFSLTLKIDPDIVYLNSVSKVTVYLDRLVHKDSLSSSVTMSMKMDAIGGTLDMHSYGISSASSFSVSISDEEKSQFEVLASFVPSSTYSTSSGGYYYNYKENGLITASFNGLNVSLPIKLVVPR